MSPVADQCRTCINNLKSISATLETSERNDERVGSVQVNEELDRFSLWVGNIGALHPPESLLSLEKRLHSAEDVLSHILELLGDLKEVTDELFEIVSGHREGRTSLALSDSTGLTDGNDEEDDMEGEDKELNEETELLEQITSSITRLFRISGVIRQAAPTDVFTKALSRNRYRFNDQFDVAHVGEKFPKLSLPESAWLRKRLGRAITQRRHYLSYIQDHRDRLEVLLSHDENLEATDEAVKSVLPSLVGGLKKPQDSASTRPSTFFTKATSLAPDRITPQMLTAEDESDPDNDARSYTTISRSVDGDPDSATATRIPKLEELRTGKRKEIECPFCFRMKKFKNERAWKRHVFSDIKVYVCTFSGCDSPLFGDINQWFRHELENHRVEYACRLCKGKSYQLQERYIAHTRRQHPEVYQSGGENAVLEMGRKPLDQIPVQDCPCCTDWADRLTMRAESQVWSPQKLGNITTVFPTYFKRHLASHLEQLALFAIPVGSASGDEVKSNAAVEENKNTLSDISELTFQSNRPSTSPEDGEGGPERREDRASGPETGSSTPTKKFEDPDLVGFDDENLEFDIIIDAVLYNYLRDEGQWRPLNDLHRSSDNTILFKTQDPSTRAVAGTVKGSQNSLHEFGSKLSALIKVALATRDVIRHTFKNIGLVAPIFEGSYHFDMANTYGVTVLSLVSRSSANNTQFAIYGREKDVEGAKVHMHRVEDEFNKRSLVGPELEEEDEESSVEEIMESLLYSEKYYEILLRRSSSQLDRIRERCNVRIIFPGKFNWQGDYQVDIHGSSKNVIDAKKEMGQILDDAEDKRKSTSLHLENWIYKALHTEKKTDLDDIRERNNVSLRFEENPYESLTSCSAIIEGLSTRVGLAAIALKDLVDEVQQGNKYEEPEDASEQAEEFVHVSSRIYPVLIEQSHDLIEDIKNACGVRIMFITYGWVPGQPEVQMFARIEGPSDSTATAAAGFKALVETKSDILEEKKESDSGFETSKDANDEDLTQEIAAVTKLHPLAAFEIYHRCLSIKTFSIWGLALEQGSPLLKPDDILKLQSLDNDQKQKYQSAMEKQWVLVQSNPIGSPDHKSAQQRLQLWSTNLIVQERRFRSGRQQQQQEYPREFSEPSVNSMQLKVTFPPDYPKAPLSVVLDQANLPPPGASLTQMQRNLDSIAQAHSAVGQRSLEAIVAYASGERPLIEGSVPTEFYNLVGSQDAPDRQSQIGDSRESMLLENSGETKQRRLDSGPLDLEGGTYGGPGDLAAPHIQAEVMPTIAMSPRLPVVGILQNDARRPQYTYWRHGIKSALILKDTWKFCDGGFPMPMPVSGADLSPDLIEQRKSWTRKDRDVKLDIFLSVSDDIKLEVFGSTLPPPPPAMTSAQMFEALDNHFDSFSLPSFRPLVNESNRVDHSMTEQKMPEGRPATYNAHNEKASEEEGSGMDVATETADVWPELLKYYNEKASITHLLRPAVTTHKRALLTNGYFNALMKLGAGSLPLLEYKKSAIMFEEEVFKRGETARGYIENMERMIIQTNRQVDIQNQTTRSTEEGKGGVTGQGAEEEGAVGLSLEPLDDRLVKEGASAVETPDWSVLLEYYQTQSSDVRNTMRNVSAETRARLAFEYFEALMVLEHKDSGHLPSVEYARKAAVGFEHNSYYQQETADEYIANMDSAVRRIRRMCKEAEVRAEKKSSEEQNQKDEGGHTPASPIAGDEQDASSEREDNPTLGLTTLHIRNAPPDYHRLLNILRKYSALKRAVHNGKDRSLVVTFESSQDAASALKGLQDARFTGMSLEIEYADSDVGAGGTLPEGSRLVNLGFSFPEGDSEARIPNPSHKDAIDEDVESHSVVEELPADMPPFLKSTQAHIRDQFARLEWEQRKRLLQATAVMSEDGPSKWTFPPAEITLGRDRFENVQPFEYNRVKMQVPEGENDYINASMIKLGRFNYIAAQAPMESTVTHFWNMIDRYHRKDINLRIVMLTNFHEFNEQKCYTYFPEDLGTIADYESRPTDTDYQRLYRIETASVTDEARTANYTQRTLKVKKTGLIKQLEIRRDHNFREFEVEHAHFHGWQDSSVPQGIAKDGLIAMIRALFDYPEQATLVVHDSAGVGRTGVYIALDMLLCGLDNGTWSSETSGEEADEEEDPIFAVVNNLRKQRINMVQNEAQYAFLYEVLRVEWIRKFGKKAKSPTIAATDWSS